MLGRRTMVGFLGVCLAAAGATLVTAATAATACVGDCDGSGDVAVNKLITMVNIALGNAALSDCTAGDADNSGDITIDEIIAAVNNALGSCPTPMPTAMPTATTTTHTVVVGPNGDFAFSPSSLTIQAGDTVQWTWSSSGHNVVSGNDCVADDQFCSPTDSGCAETLLSSKGATYSHTFTTEGTYPYFCNQHCGLGMVGTITVAPPAFAAAPLIKYVDPFIGSGGLGYGFGSAVTGAVAPFGMVRLAPDTSKGGLIVPFYNYSGYYYDNQTILGFSHLHFHGTGAPGYGDLLVMPVPGFTPDKMKAAGYRSNYSKSTEIASPGYYSARLNNGNILAELTSTGHVGLHRYTFPAGASGAAVVIDAGHLIAGSETTSISQATNIELTIDPDGRTVVGHHRADGGLSGGFDLYWVIAFDHPLKGYGGWSGQDVLANTTSISAPTGGGGAYLEFDVADGGTVNLRVGLSMVDLDGAKNNLAAEAPDFDFDAARQKSEAQWESMLGRVKIVATDPRHLRMFYTAAYHALIMPTILSDTDGRYRGFDHHIHQADGFHYYSDMSLWDTFRTLHPWLTLVYPDVQRDIVISLLKMYEQDGFLPIWPVSQGDSGTMIGASAELVIADSFVKGIRDYDTGEAYQAVTRSGREPSPPGSTSPGRRHIEDYLALGYVPTEDDGSAVSMTLEYAASDGALSEFAKAFGRDADAAEFAGRAGNYRTQWDPGTKFFRAKHRDGSFKAPFDPLKWGADYREATAWQYLWYVPHDPQGLMTLFGGRDSFVASLEAFFEQSKQEQDHLTDLGRQLYRLYYWAGNEPDIHTAYLFVAAGRPDLAGRWSRWALENLYGDGPDGLPGNDDCGTMSSWYLFTALGFYPVPGYDKYYVGAPLFPTATITLPNGVLRIDAPGAGPDNYIPQSASLDGKRLDDFTFHHSDLAHGGVLTVPMAAGS